MFKFVILIICFIVLLNNTSSFENVTLSITEIFPDPPGKDNFNINTREFLELYNYGNNEIDLSKVKIQNNKNKSFQISEFQFIKPKQYLVIYPSLKFSLKNKGDEKISLFYNDFLIDEVYYSYSKESFSWLKLNNTWILGKSTPGYSIIKEPKNLNNSKNKSSLKFTTLNSEKESEKLLNISNKPLPQTVYESNAFKQRRLGLYFFIVVLIFIILYQLINDGKKRDKSESNY